MVPRRAACLPTRPAALVADDDLQAETGETGADGGSVQEGSDPADAAAHGSRGATHLGSRHQAAGGRGGSVTEAEFGDSFLTEFREIMESDSTGAISGSVTRFTEPREIDRLGYEPSSARRRLVCRLTARGRSLVVVLEAADFDARMRGNTTRTMPWNRVQAAVSLRSLGRISVQASREWSSETVRR